MQKKEHQWSRKRTWFAGLASAALLVTGLPATTTHATTLSEAQQQQQQATQKAAQLRQQLDQYQQQENTFLQQITELDDQISLKMQQAQQLSDQIDQTNRQIHQIQQRIDTVHREIQATNQRIAQRQQFLDQRLRATYEDGTVSYLAVLFSATSFNDFLTRLENLTLIAKQDQTIIQEQKDDLAKQQQQQQQLSQAEQQLHNAQNDLLQQQQQLTATKADLQQQEQQVKKQLGITSRGRTLTSGKLEDTLALAQQMQAQIKQMQQQEAAASHAAAPASRPNPAPDAHSASTAALPQAPSSHPVSSPPESHTSVEPAQPAAPPSHQHPSSPPPAASSSSRGDRPEAGSPTVPVSSSASAAQVIQIGKQYLGMPYVWGGNSPATSFDCSGFTQYVYGQVGISLPHSAQGQWNVTQHVSASQAQPGDLVFFTGTYDAGGAVTHVGIYLGGGQMLAADAPGVEITSIGFSYWQQHLYGFGRVAH